MEIIITGKCPHRNIILCYNIELEFYITIFRDNKNGNGYLNLNYNYGIGEN